MFRLQNKLPLQIFAFDSLFHPALLLSYLYNTLLGKNICLVMPDEFHLYNTVLQPRYSAVYMEPPISSVWKSQLLLVT